MKVIHSVCLSGGAQYFVYPEAEAKIGHQGFKLMFLKLRTLRDKSGSHALMREIHRKNWVCTDLKELEFTGLS